MRDDKDRSGKWIIEHHGDAVLRLGGVSGFRTWRAIQAEVVQPRQLPDGLLEVFFPDQEAADLFVVEIATYPERRVEEQVLRNALLVLLDRRVLPEIVTLVLHPKGSFRLSGAEELVSRHGLTQLTCRWRVVELWTVSAAELLAANDVGLIPWVPLARFDDPPEVIVRQCYQRIEQQARPEERPTLLAITQVMTRLRYNDPALLALLGGSRAMIEALTESPLIQELVDLKLREIKDQNRQVILKILERRFGTVPPDVTARLQAVQDESKLQDLTFQAATCPDLEAFRVQLLP